MEPSTSSGRKRSTNNDDSLHFSKKRRLVMPSDSNFESTMSSRINCEDPSGSETEDVEDTFVPEQHGEPKEEWMK